MRKTELSTMAGGNAAKQSLSGSDMWEMHRHFAQSGEQRTMFSTHKAMTEEHVSQGGFGPSLTSCVQYDASAVLSTALLTQALFIL